MKYHVFDNLSGMFVHPDNNLNPVEPYIFNSFESALAAKWAVLAANHDKHSDFIEIQPLDLD